MKSIYLVFGTYNQLPVGNGDKLCERSYQEALKPFLSAVNRYPNFPVVLYYSGMLLEWIEKNHPEFIMLVSEMVKRRQVELMTGGYYEPVLPLIPNTDKLGQIEKLTTFLRTRFGRRPRGSWLTEHVWEPSLAYTLSTSGIEYTFLTDEHFQYTGLEDEELYYPYLTEDQGKTVIVLPISEQLRNQVPNTPPEEVLAEIMSHADSSETRVISLILDGRGLCLSGEGNTAVFQLEWVERFFQIIEERRDIVVPIIPGKFVRETVPRRKIYFPTTSYAEMMSWLLPSEDRGSVSKIARRAAADPGLKSYLKGGLFRHFLTRYPESNLMYSKMMYVHLLVNQIRGDKYRKKTAREELWRGQCNFAYWHGRSGGIYLRCLRKTIYGAFIESEKVTRSSEAFSSSIVSFDFDMDGSKEYLYQSEDLNAYVHTQGGMIFELDYVPVNWNYCDTMSRRPEFYHRKEDRIYDWYLRKAFIDHLFSESETLDGFRDLSYKEQGDFVAGVYEVEKTDREHFELVLERRGSLRLKGRPVGLKISKRYRFRGASLKVTYTVTNLSEETVPVRFGNEVNLSFVSDDPSDFCGYATSESGKEQALDSRNGERTDTVSLRLQDLANDVEIELAAERAFALWSFPIETASNSHGAYEKTYQSSCFVPLWGFQLEPGESWKNTVSLSFKRT